MRRRFHPAPVLLAVLIAHAQETPPKPYHDPRNTTLTYNGPGRDDPDPTDLTEVRIGYFGPADGTHREGGQMWQGASLAIEEANAQGGYRGLPFRLVPAWAANPWAGGVANLARITYDRKVWAILGGIDGATTHLAEQVVAKAQLTLINPAATDRSIHAAGVPWMFSCVPGDDVLAGAISQELHRRAGRFAILSAIDHDSRAFEAELELALARDRLVPMRKDDWAGAPEDPARIVHDVIGAAPDAIVVIAPAHETADLVEAIRYAGFAGAVLSGPWIARDIPGPSLAGVLYPALAELPAAFRARFQARWARAPDYTAAFAYDAANILVAAIRNAGVNRARIRDAVRALSPVNGVTGRIEWDAQGQNRKAVSLGAFAAAVQMQNP
jgi:branched-chain amino acid transport system substrate-binding protein